MAIFIDFLKFRLFKKENQTVKDAENEAAQTEENISIKDDDPRDGSPRENKEKCVPEVPDDPAVVESNGSSHANIQDQFIACTKTMSDLKKNLRLNLGWV
jgi:hypothetical protein